MDDNEVNVSMQIRLSNCQATGGITGVSTTNTRIDAMNVVKQSCVAILWVLICEGAVAQSKIVQYGTSYEASLLPGSQLVAVGRDEFFITGNTQEMLAPTKNQPRPVVAAAKQASIKTDITDVSEQRINRLLALHKRITMISHEKKVQYASLRQNLKHKMG